MQIINLKNTREVGEFAEKTAKQYLLNKGYKFLAANYHCRYGEIDLIFFAPDKPETVFVEVKSLWAKEFFVYPAHRPKSKTTDQHFFDLEGDFSLFQKINRRKINRLARCADFFLSKNKNFHLREYDWRIDIIGIKFFRNSQNTLNKQIFHLKALGYD